MRVAPVSSLTITPYQRRHLQPIRDLLFHSPYVHSHLDWLDSDQWLETNDSMTLLAWQQGRLVGVLGLSSPLNKSSIVLNPKVFCVHSGMNSYPNCTN